MSCIFCKIIKNEIPCHKIFESSKTLAFLDINPLSEKHILVIPKTHAALLHQVPDDNLQEIGTVIKKVALAIGCENYNVLQNNGRIAHQEVDHVHFHIIPKNTDQDGLGIRWNSLKLSKEKLENLAKEVVTKI